MNTARTGWRASTTAEVLNIAFGIWLAISPFVLGFAHNVAATWNNVCVGIALILVALAGWRQSAFEVLTVPLGAWLFASPFVLGFAIAAVPVNNVLTALVVIATAAIYAEVRSWEVPTLPK